MTVADFYRGGSGTPLVLLHGATGSWHVWGPVLGLLEVTHEVYAPTLLGHRGGPVPDNPPPAFFCVADFADAVQRQLVEAGLSTAHLVGNSLGGAVALELARRGHARSVVAIAPYGAWRSRRDLERLILLVRALGRFALNPAVRRLLARPGPRRHLLRVAAEHGDRIPASELRGMLDDILACTVLDGIIAGTRRDGPMEPFEPAGYPVRIAWPQHDRTIPYRRYGAPLLARVPGAEVLVLPGVGHVPMYDDPALVARSILHVTTAVDAAADNRPEPREDESPQ